MSKAEDKSKSDTVAQLISEGIPPLSMLYLYLTNGCNLCCKHCWITPTFVNGAPSPGQYIDTDLLFAAIAEAKPLGLNSVKLTGGEPLLHPSFRKIAAFLAEQDIHSDMETNGTLIDADMASFIKNSSTIDFVSVSLDSPVEDDHDSFRGVKGAFRAACEGIQHLCDNGIHPQIIMSPYKGNVQQVDEMVQLAEKLGAASIKFNIITNAGRGRAMHENNEVLTYEEYRAFLRYVYGALQGKTALRLIVNAPMALLSVEDLLHEKWRGVCNVGNIMGILASGHMALCGIGQNVPDLCYGKLGVDKISAVWRHTPILKEIRKGLEGPFPGICTECIHASLCRTGCLAMNYMNNGKLFAPSPWCVEAAERNEFPRTRTKDYAISNT